MTILHKSTLALRRLSIGNKHKRTYTHLSHPVHRISESASASTSTISRLRANNWIFVPAAIALLGLGFSTFSTHQLMCCNNNNEIISTKKP